MQVALLGEAVDLTYKYEHLGSDPLALNALANSPFMAKLKAAKNPAIVVGPGVLKRPDREAVLKAVHELVENAGEYWCLLPGCMQLPSQSLQPEQSGGLAEHYVHDPLRRRGPP